ncbi:cwf21-domain-containing protein [Atractiella rhizophila]|nr:cwf21-domain-containing protein [Atractiella rhizophila]
MSYNGIGLTTPRGSGTSGYIQRNLAALRVRDSAATYSPNADYSIVTHRTPDASILEHERKRAIENKCMELQIELEDEGVGEEEVTRRVEELREKLKAEEGEVRRRLGERESGTEMTLRKVEETEKMRKALGISEHHVEGRAFNKEAQVRIPSSHCIFGLLNVIGAGGRSAEKTRRMASTSDCASRERSEETNGTRA